MSVFECDMTNNDIHNFISENTIDIVMLIFVLSAIPPFKMLNAIMNLSKVCFTFD